MPFSFFFFFYDVNDEYFKLMDEEISINNFNDIDVDINVKQKRASIFKNIDEYYDFVKLILYSQKLKLDELSKQEISNEMLKHFNYACDFSKYLNIYDNIFSVIKDGGAKPEKAHIIGRNKSLVPAIMKAKTLKEKNEIFLYGIKHLNCLYLTPNLHSNYDNNLISINPVNGQIWDVKKQCYLSDFKINEKELKDKYKYLLSNWNNFKKYNKNL